jgi:hypothetical protein
VSRPVSADLAATEGALLVAKRAAKRRYNVDPVVAHNRAVKANAASRLPEAHIRALGRAELTDDHKLRLAELIAPRSWPESSEAWFAKLLADWPPLGPRQREELRALLDLGDRDEPG